MTNLLAIYKRELRAYFTSPIAYVMFTIFLVLCGVFFALFFQFYNAQTTQMLQQRMSNIPTINDFVISRLFFNIAVVLLFITPMLTMRLFAEEARTGTMEMLLTFPIRDFELIAGKFLASMTVVLGMIAATGLYPVFVSQVTTPEWAPILTGYLGLILISGCFVSVGMFLSSLTENQIVAAFMTFGVLLTFWLIGAAESFLTGTPLGAVLGHLSITSHLESFVKGLIETKDVVYYLDFILLSLFFTYLSVQSRRWRG